MKVHHRLTFRCDPCDLTWDALRRQGEVWFADYCKTCAKVRRYVGAERVEEEEPADVYVREAQF